MSTFVSNLVLKFFLINILVALNIFRSFLFYILSISCFWLHLFVLSLAIPSAIYRIWIWFFLTFWSLGNSFVFYACIVLLYQWEPTSPLSFKNMNQLIFPNFITFCDPFHLKTFWLLLPLFFIQANLAAIH